MIWRFMVRVGVVFAGAVVPIGGSRLVRGKFFQPDFVIVMQPAFIIVDEYGGGDMHRVDQA